MFNYFLSIQVTGAYLVLIIVMFFFCLLMFRQNKFLKNELEKLKEENETLVLSRSKFKSSKCNKDVDTVPIQKISEEIVEKTVTKDEKVIGKDNNENVSVQKNDIKENRLYSNDKNVYKAREHNYGDLQDSNKIYQNSNSKLKIDENKKVENNKKKNYYSKNVLQNKKQVTSPVSIDKRSFDMDKLSFDLNEFIKKEKKVVPKIVEKSNSLDYLQEVSDKLAGEIGPQTIELTDYEKKQEESAIISYQELLKVKDQLQTIDDEDETLDFLEELKSFRNSLN